MEEDKEERRGRWRRRKEDICEGEDREDGEVQGSRVEMENLKSC